jgi:hypothetical protein
MVVFGRGFLGRCTRRRMPIIAVPPMRTGQPMRAPGARGPGLGYMVVAITEGLIRREPRSQYMVLTMAYSLARCRLVETRAEKRPRCLSIKDATAVGNS